MDAHTVAALRAVRAAWHDAVRELSAGQLIELIDEFVSDLEGYREGAEFESDRDEDDE